MSSDASTKIDVWLAIGFGAGLYYFYKGFRTFREYQVLMDTPEVPIRSVAMGLVDIHGKATGVPPIPSPVTQTPCHFYKVDIEHWVSNKNGGSWHHLATDLITWRSEKEIRKTLRSRTAKYIFGGAFLAVACLAVFLAKHGAF